MALAVGGQPLSVSFAFFLYYRRQTNMNLHQMFFYKKKKRLANDGVVRPNTLRFEDLDLLHSE